MRRAPEAPASKRQAHEAPRSAKPTKQGSTSKARMRKSCRTRHSTRRGRDRPEAEGGRRHATTDVRFVILPHDGVHDRRDHAKVIRCAMMMVGAVRCSCRNRWHKSVAGTLSVASKKIITATLKTCPTNGLTPAFLSLESVARGSPLLLRRLEPCLEDDVVGEQRRRLPRLFLPPDPLDEIHEALALALLAMYRLDVE